MMDRKFRWKVVLPIIQLFLGVGLWLWTPLQFRSQMLARMHLSPQQMAGRSLALAPAAIDLHYPPPAGRLLCAVNYPAYVASNGVEQAIRRRQTPAYFFAIGPYTYMIGARELAFFMGICALWIWVGIRIDELVSSIPSSPRRGATVPRVIEAVFAFALGTVLLRSCILYLTAINSTPPFRMIATFALVWPAIFYADLYWIVKQQFFRTGASST
ncbi:MAG: hypothetical protein WBG09_16850 [Candidatus Sulfotelmatobacter sp.]